MQFELVAVGNPNGQPPPWEGRGAAWEYMVELANETGKDLWINVPERATDDYVNKLALLCKYGSDGINPYTGPQANPAWPPLNSNLKLYVEFSNEVWNTAGSFEQSQDNHNSAIAEVHAGGSPLNFDTDTNDWNWAWRRVAKRIVEKIRAASGTEVPLGELDITLYRDDFSTSGIQPVVGETRLDFDIDDKQIVLVDDVQ